MANVYELVKGTQEGTFNLNDRELSFEIGYSDYSKLYYINIYENNEPLIVGKNLTNGTDLLYNKEHLALGNKLQYRGENDLSKGYLVYE